MPAPLGYSFARCTRAGTAQRAIPTIALNTYPAGGTYSRVSCSGPGEVPLNAAGTAQLCRSYLRDDEIH